jgi:hypothetical protein
LQAGQAVAHFAFKFGLGGQCGDRVNHDQVDRRLNAPGCPQFPRLVRRCRVG